MNKSGFAPSRNCGRLNACSPPIFGFATPFPLKTARSKSRLGRVSETGPCTQGFTLVEIMIVVVIVGLLAMLAIPAFRKVRASSQERAIINNLRQIHYAAQQYFLETGETTVARSQLVGNGKHIKIITAVAGEVYPATITQTDTLISATGTSVEGKPTIDYSN